MPTTRFHLLTGLLLSAACHGQTQRVLLQPTAASQPIARPALYPETLEVNPQTGRFLLGSIRHGAVYEVALDGSLREFVDDPRLTSILGIAADARGQRLLVTNSDLGAGVKHSTPGPRKEAGVAIYDLTTRKRLHYVDLTALLPGSDHLINGIALDPDGNAYATDSFAPAIYKIDPAGNASVFLQHDEFKGAGINLNGIVYHPKGFLLAINKSNGVLYRIPLADPQHFTRVSLPDTFIGGDGLLLAGEEQLILIANKTPAHVSESAFSLRSSDDWTSARVLESKSLGSVYPTTAAALNGKIYLLSSRLDELIGANDSTRDAIVQQGRRAELREIGRITH